MRAAAIGQGKTALTADDLKQMLQAAIGGIKERGKATTGEKTMLDALEPAHEAFMASGEKGGSLADCFAAARDQALASVEYTKTIIARKGRASYLGERSLGHQDPGATSVYLMLSALTDYCRRLEV